MFCGKLVGVVIKKKKIFRKILVSLVLNLKVNQKKSMNRQNQPSFLDVLKIDLSAQIKKWKKFLIRHYEKTRNKNLIAALGKQNF